MALLGLHGSSGLKYVFYFSKHTLENEFSFFNVKKREPTGYTNPWSWSIGRMAEVDTKECSVNYE